MSRSGPGKMSRAQKSKPVATFDAVATSSLLCVREVQNAGCCLLEARAVRPGLLEWKKRRKGIGSVSI